MKTDIVENTNTPVIGDIVEYRYLNNENNFIGILSDIVDKGETGIVFVLKGNISLYKIIKVDMCHLFKFKKVLKLYN